MIINSDYNMTAEVKGYRIRYTSYYTKDAWNGNPRVEITDTTSDVPHTFVMDLDTIYDLTNILDRISGIHRTIPTKDSENYNERFTD